MRYGKLFRFLKSIADFANTEFSSNTFRGLTYAELRTIARVLNSYNAWSYGNYTHFTREELATAVYRNVNSLYNNIDSREAIIRDSRDAVNNINNYIED